MYRGQDDRGRPYSLVAGEAVQSSASVPVVRLEDLVARILLSDGPAVLTAPVGRYAMEEERVAVPGVVRFRAADGYRMDARNVAIDLTQGTLRGEGRVEGTVPAGSFAANSIRADLEARTITLDGDARLTMVPGQLRMPGGVE
jgi:lipopolysaccharide export system protein LptC